MPRSVLSKHIFNHGWPEWKWNLEPRQHRRRAPFHRSTAENEPRRDSASRCGSPLRALHSNNFCNFPLLFFFPLLFAAPASALLRPHMFNTHAHAHRHVLVGADASLQALHWVSERSKGHYKLQVVSLPLSTAIRTVALSLSAKNYTIDLFVRVCTCVNVCVCEKDGRGSACVCLCAWTLS